jgi:hypothetical protein
MVLPPRYQPINLGWISNLNKPCSDDKGCANFSPVGSPPPQGIPPDPLKCTPAFMVIESLPQGRTSPFLKTIFPRAHVIQGVLFIACTTGGAGRRSACCNIYISIYLNTCCVVGWWCYRVMAEGIRGAAWGLWIKLFFLMA